MRRAQRRPDRPGDFQTESTVQKRTSDYARGLGLRGFKFSSESRRAVPDYVYFGFGHTLFIEFKKTGEVATKAQAREHVKLREKGQLVYVVDHSLDGKDLIDRFVRFARQRRPMSEESMPDQSGVYKRNVM